MNSDNLAASSSRQAPAPVCVHARAASRKRRLPRTVDWVASLQCALRNNSATPTQIAPDRDLDASLNQLWERYASEDKDIPSQFLKRVAELKSFYEAKLQEIASKEAEYTGTGQDTTLTSDSDGVRKSVRRILEPKAKRKFNVLRIQLKKAVFCTLKTLKDTYKDNEKAARKRGLPSEAVKAMNHWFDSHSNNPYPSEAEKDAIATRYGISIDQVSTWFSNKRYRNHS